MTDISISPSNHNEDLKTKKKMYIQSLRVKLDLLSSLLTEVGYFISMPPSANL